MVAGVFQQKGIVAVRRGDLGVAHVDAVVDQGLDDLTAAGWCKAPVGGETQQRETLAVRSGKGFGQVTSKCRGRVKVVQRAGDQQVGVGVKVFAELVALVAQVALDLELDVLGGVAQLGSAHLAAELLFHRVVAEVGDVADHAGHPQAAARQHAMRTVVAAVEIGVGDDGAAGHLVEGDVLGRQVGRGGHGDAFVQPLGVAQRPAQRLHATQAATQHGGQALDAQGVEQPGLGVDPVFHRHHRKVGAPGPAGGAVDMHRPGGAEAGAQVVDADDEELVGVQRLARTDQVVPPALALVLPFVGAGHVVAGVERVAHQHGIAARSVERAVGLVDQLVAGQLRAAAQRQRLVEAHRLRADVPDGTHGLNPLDGLNEKTRCRCKRGPPGQGVTLLAAFVERPQSWNKSALCREV